MCIINIFPNLKKSPGGPPGVPRGTPGGLFENFFKNQKMTSRMLRQVRPDPKRSYDGKYIVLQFSTKFEFRPTKAQTCRAGDILKNR